jgi:hydrogenase 3 maturation protease
LGLEIARRLEARFTGQAERYIVAAGPTPEAFTGPLRRFQPQQVILVDAAIMGLPPGGRRWLDWRETNNYSASTHSLPLHLLADYLESELGCEVLLLGVQPGQNALDTPLSPPVAAAVEAAVEEIAARL